MIDLRLKLKDLIANGFEVKKINYVHNTDSDILMPDYIAGKEYDLWMNEISIFSKRYLQLHPLFSEIMKAYEIKNHDWGTTSYDNMMGYLEAIYKDDEFFETTNDIKNQEGKKTKSVFLCHSSKDKFFVRELAERLSNNGVKVWIDEAEINIGDSLTDKIGKAIVDTDYVCAVLSYNSINSNWVQKELQVALQKEFEGKKVVILPILLEPVEIPPFLKDKLYADFSTPEKYNSNFPSLLKSLGINVTMQNVKINENNKIKDGLEFVPYIKKNNDLNDFIDIRITEMDEKKSYKPDENKLLYNIYFKLSDTPPSEWDQIFEAERRYPRHTMWRRAWVEGNYLIINCVPDELEKYHLNDLNEDTNNTNHKYRQYLKEIAIHEIKERNKEKEEKQNLIDLKQKLKFD